MRANEDPVLNEDSVINRHVVLDFDAIANHDTPVHVHILADDAVASDACFLTNLSLVPDV
jgi:hypothetical protein